MGARRVRSTLLSGDRKEACRGLTQGGVSLSLNHVQCCRFLVEGKRTDTQGTVLGRGEGRHHQGSCVPHPDIDPDPSSFLHMENALHITDQGDPVSTHKGHIPHPDFLGGTTEEASPPSLSPSRDSPSAGGLCEQALTPAGGRWEVQEQQGRQQGPTVEGLDSLRGRVSSQPLPQEIVGQFTLLPAGSLS